MVIVILQLFNGLVSFSHALFSSRTMTAFPVARALISNPRILIFDEATSALDYESEKIIRDNMNMISKGRTTIVIAHRLSTIKDSDLIVCFDEGEIVEKGTHDELMQLGGYYKKLYEAQLQ